MGGTRYAQFCALARAAEILGERWTLLVIRELLLGPRRFSDLIGRLDGVSPTMLTARLGALVESGIVRRATLPMPINAQVYELTEIGRDLQPAIRELIRWGGHFLFPMRSDDTFEPDWVLLALDAIACRTPTPACRIGLRVVHQRTSAGFLVEGGPEGTSISAGEPSGVPSLETRFDTLLRIVAAELSIEEAITTQGAKLTGALRYARKLPQLFDLRGRRSRRLERAAGKSPV